jgi:hypothetical protein
MAPDFSLVDIYNNRGHFKANVEINVSAMLLLIHLLYICVYSVCKGLLYILDPV